MGALVIRPETITETRFGGPVEVSGFMVADRRVHIFCRTLAAAKRIAVAVLEGDNALVDRILIAEKGPLFCVEDVSERVAVLVKQKRLTVYRTCANHEAALVWSRRWARLCDVLCMAGREEADRLWLLANPSPYAEAAS
jgi:hypothetical protein